MSSPVNSPQLKTEQTNSEKVRPSKPGFRLHRLEVYNWGTFDSASNRGRGEVFCVEPKGETGLLIGRNGSGKSTLVDSLLTLLVRPAVRNYNVAAGAKKRERDERSYIRGAYDRRSGDQESGVQVQYLRPDNSHYSVLLANFLNEASGKTFTLAQVLYVTADGRAERIYCFDTTRRTIADDCSGLKKSEMLQQLRGRGFRATRNYSEYHEWFRRTTGMQRKAMDMLNQTVAVKDIQRLTAFIRDHMLESRAWGQTVDSLLTHFGQLSESHQTLVRVRDQLKLLEPIEEDGRCWQEQTAELDRAEDLLAATDAFFRQQVIELFEPECRDREAELNRIRGRKDELAALISDTQGSIRRIENEIDNAGGDRRKEIPRLIALERKDAENKRLASKQFHHTLHDAGIQETVGNAEDLQRVLALLPERRETVARELAKAANARDEIVVQTAGIRANLKDAEAELAALRIRGSNLPRNFVEVRERLCRALHLNCQELPFAAELIAVAEAHHQWAPSIEMLLRGFALSLLVPERHYMAVSRYMNEYRLEDSRAVGQKLVYLRVGERQQKPNRPALDLHSLVRKLLLRDDHPLLPWVRAELEDRFNYLCCDTVDDFLNVRGPAITPDRHLRSGERHIKDDRSLMLDPGRFVLGWSNQRKKQHLQTVIDEMHSELARFDDQLKQLRSDEQKAHRSMTALESARGVSEFSQIDFQSHDIRIVQLQQECAQLDEGNDVVSVLKEKLADHKSHESRLMVERDQISVQEGECRVHLSEAQRLVENAQRQLADLEASGALKKCRRSFDQLKLLLGTRTLTVRNFHEFQKKFRDDRESHRGQLQAAVRPLQVRLLEQMSRFLARFPEEKSDLHPSTDYLDSFLGLLENIRNDDLPRHERRFKERLNDKVIREIGLLNSELEKELYAIEDKIELLNQALTQLEYRPGTHMKLEARSVSDREIQDFRNELHSCLDDAFAGSNDSEERRFERIERLIHRLRDEERWRNKVIDVRRWFEFAAREVDDLTGEERGYYEDSTGQSGGEKAKLAFTILVAAIAYQYDIEPGNELSDRFHFVVVDEMFSKIDDQYAEYALELFRKFGLQLLIVAPLDAKARVTEQHVGCYMLVTKDEHSRSRIHSMTARELTEHMDNEVVLEPNPSSRKPR